MKCCAYSYSLTFISSIYFYSFHRDGMKSIGMLFDVIKIFKTIDRKRNPHVLTSNVRVSKCVCTLVWPCFCIHFGICQLKLVSNVYFESFKFKSEMNLQLTATDHTLRWKHKRFSVYLELFLRAFIPCVGLHCTVSFV